MKARMHFDTLTYANKLKAAGMDPKLAEVQALALVEALDDGVATKSDIAELRSEIHDLRIEIKNQFHTETGLIRGDISSLQGGLMGQRGDFDAKLATLKSDLIQWMVGLFITSVSINGIFIAIAQFISHSH